MLRAQRRATCATHKGVSTKDPTDCSKETGSAGDWTFLCVIAEDLN